MSASLRTRHTHPKAGAPSRLRSRLLELGIIVATVLVSVFVFSFSTRLGYSGSETQEPPVVVRVQVLNGCGRPGLARRVSDRLAELSVGRMRFDVVDIGNYDRTTIRESFAINRQLVPSQARDIVRALQLGDCAIQDNSGANDLGVDLTIVLGSEIVEPQPPTAQTTER